MKFTSLKILTDENISPGIVRFLRDKRFDVLDTKEQNWCGKEDAFILLKSLAENRFVLTYDSDFGTMIIHNQRQFFGIIYLRLARLNFSNTIEILNKLIAHNPVVKPHQIVVVTENKIRIRQVVP
jgi:predicted nuclease of predicted toxin-antitoxin system